jgi:hypothetical protein
MSVGFSEGLLLLFMAPPVLALGPSGWLLFLALAL